MNEIFRCKFARLFCLILLSQFYLSCQPFGKTLAIRRVNNAVVCVSVVFAAEGKEKRIADGTGFFIGENLVATAFHVEEEIEHLITRFPREPHRTIAWKKFDSGETLQTTLELVAFDKDSDLAIFRADGEPLKSLSPENKIVPLALADDLPQIGEEVVSTAYYGEYESPFNSLGNVSMIDKNEEIYSDMTLMPGFSGSPLYSPRTGAVVGINKSVMTIGDGTMRLGIAAKSARLKELLAKISQPQ